MGFGMISCVESEESQSVRDIRDAKAEQLKALAELSRAQAQAAIITAEAEAALNAAEAEYRQNQTAEAKAKFAYEIEKIKAQYESQVLMYKQQALAYEKQVQDAMNALEDAVNDRIEALYTEYTGYVASLNNANDKLFGRKIDLANVEAEIIDITEAANKEIEDNTALVEELEAQLAILTDNAYTQMDKDSLTNEYLKALAAFNDADYKYKSTELVAYTKAEEAAKKASDDYINDYNNKVAEMDALEGGIVASVEGDKVWTDEKPRVAFDIVYFAYAYVDTDNDPTTPDEQIIVDTDSPLWDGDWDNVVKHDGRDAIKYINNRRIETDYNDVFEHLEVFINETPLLKLKNDSASDLKDAQDDLEGAEKALKVATDAKAAMEGFKADFEKAAEAKKAIDAFAEAYGKYDEDTETVKAKEAKLAKVKADTNGVANVYSHNFNKPYETLINAKAALDVLTNDENEGYATNSFVKALADAKAALAALPTTATAAEKAAAEGNVTTAQKALDKEIYNKGVYLESAKATVAQYEDDIKTAEKEVAEAQENEKALLAASTAVEAAVETLNSIFGEESDFYAFWNNEDEDGNSVNKIAGIPEISTMNAVVLADLNNDKTPDLDLTADDGLYLTDSEEYSYFATEYDALLAEYVGNIAKETDNVATYTETVKSLGEWVNNWDAKEAELRAWVEAKNAEIAEVRAAYEEFTKAEDANEAAKKNVDALLAEYQALSTLLTSNGNDDLKNKIREIEGKITTAETAIKDAKLVLANLKTAKPSWSNWSDNYQTIAYKEKLVEQYKAEIAKYEEEIKFYTQMVANAKAALDAELSAQNAE